MRAERQPRVRYLRRTWNPRSRAKAQCTRTITLAHGAQAAERTPTPPPLTHMIEDRPKNGSGTPTWSKCAVMVVTMVVLQLATPAAWCDCTCSPQASIPLPLSIQAHTPHCASRVRAPRVSKIGAALLRLGHRSHRPLLGAQTATRTPPRRAAGPPRSTGPGVSHFVVCVCVLVL